MRHIICVIIARLVDIFVLSDKSKRCNPRAIRFVLHYLRGSQKPMTLNKHELLCVKDMIICNLCRRYNHGLFFKDRAVPPNYSGGIDLLEDYLTSDTLGIVGGFDFVYKEDIGFICTDVWDFNPGTWLIVIPLPETLKGLVSYILDTILGIKYTCKYGKLFLIEGELVKLNTKHAFTTTWIIPWQSLTCDISNTVT